MGKIMVKRFSLLANSLALLLFFVSVLPAQRELHTQVKTSTTTLEEPLKPRKYIKGMGFNYFNIPINTWSLNNKDVARFLNIVTDKTNQPVFVHCQHGSDRTGTMVAVYRVYAQKWKAEEAMKDRKSTRLNSSHTS